MEKINDYTKLIYQFLTEIAQDSPQSQVLADEKSHHFQLMKMGYDSHGNYFFRVPMHIHLREDAKICILENTILMRMFTMKLKNRKMLRIFGL